MPVGQIVLLIVAANLAWMVLFLRGRDAGAWRYKLLLTADLMLAVLLLARRQHEGPAFAIALAVFALLVLAPMLLGAVARRALERDRIALALALTRLREWLQVGAGGSRDRGTLELLLRVRRGEAGEILDALRGRAGSAPDAADRVEAHERIVHLLCLDRRYREAIAHFEGHLPRRILEIRPVLAASLVRAYAESGDLDAAAELLDRLEAGAAGRPGTDVINQARLALLALSGQAETLADLLSPRSPFLSSMPPQARAYWRGVALRAAGREQEGRAALREAVGGGGDARLRGAVEERLARPALVPVLSGRTRALVEAATRRARAHRPLPGASGRPWRAAPVTLALCAVLVAVHLGVEWGGEIWRMRGAAIMPAIRAGELWRAVSGSFLHGFFLHLVLNVYALWILGRFVEQALGPRRFFSVYLLAGVGGFLASALHGRSPVSVGASGCVFGLIGAAIAALIARRGVWPELWRRSLLFNLILLVAINVALGLATPMVDNAAHLGGLATGLALGFLALPGGPLGRGATARAADLTLAAAASAGVLWGLWGVAAAAPERTFLDLPHATLRIGKFAIDAPVWWRDRGEEGGAPFAADPVGAALQVVALPDAPGAAQAALRARAADDQGGVRRSERSLDGPRGLPGREIAVRLEDLEVGRRIYAGRLPGGGTALAEFQFRWELRDAYRPLIDEMIPTLRRVP